MICCHETSKRTQTDGAKGLVHWKVKVDFSCGFTLSLLLSLSKSIAGHKCWPPDFEMRWHWLLLRCPLLNRKHWLHLMWMQTMGLMRCIDERWGNECFCLYKPSISSGIISYLHSGLFESYTCSPNNLRRFRDRPSRGPSNWRKKKYRWRYFLRQCQQLCSTITASVFLSISSLI